MKVVSRSEGMYSFEDVKKPSNLRLGNGCAPRDLIGPLAAMRSRPKIAFRTATPAMASWLLNRPIESMKELSSGSQGTIYAITTSGKFKYAAKKFRSVLEFKRELEFYQDVPQHPAFPRLFGVKCIDGKDYLAMELIEGVSLDKIFEKMTLDAKKIPGNERSLVASIIKIGRALFSGLAHLEMHGKSHCDIKPMNIMLGKGGALKIVDFGSHIDVNKKYDFDVFVGTAGYISKEMICHSPGTDLSKVDVFSAANVLLQGLTGFRLEQNYESIASGEEVSTLSEFFRHTLSVRMRPERVAGEQVFRPEGFLGPSGTFFGDGRSKAFEEVMGLLSDVLHSGGVDRPSGGALVKAFDKIAEEHFAVVDMNNVARRLAEMVDDFRKKPYKDSSDFRA